MGYLWEHCPGHPGANMWGHVLQHRLVAENCLMRYLTKREVVHHEDRNKHNNNPANLWLFADQQAHMRHHKMQESPRHNPEFVAAVRALEGDLGLTLEQVAHRLGCSAVTVAIVCRLHGIPWRNRNATALVEESVHEALRGRTTAEAAALLEVNHQTLRRNFPHLLRKRVSPGSLAAHKEEIRNLARTVRSAEIATRYGVGPETVKVQIRKWAREEPDAWSDVLAFQQSRLGIRWSKLHRVSDQ